MSASAALKRRLRSFVFDIDAASSEVQKTLTGTRLRVTLIPRKGQPYLNPNFAVADPKTAPETLGDRIRQKREELGLTQAQFGRRIGVSKVAVSDWERDVYAPKDENFRALEREYGASEQRLRFGAAADLPGYMPIEVLTRALLDDHSGDLPPELRQEYADFLVGLLTKYPVGLSFVNQSVGFLSAREVVTFYLDPADFEKGGEDDAQRLLTAAANALRRAMDAVETEAKRRAATGVRSPSRDEMRSMTERVKETVQGTIRSHHDLPPVQDAPARDALAKKQAQPGKHRRAR